MCAWFAGSISSLNAEHMAISHAQPSTFKGVIFKRGYCGLTAPFSALFDKNDLQEEKPTGKLCAPTKLSGCENDANKTQLVQRMHS